MLPNQDRPNVRFQISKLPRCGTLKSYETYKVINRFCWPKSGSLSIKLKAKFSQYGNSQWFADMMEAKWVILICAITAFFLSLIYLYLLEQCALVVVLGCVAAFFLSMTSLSAYCFMQWNVTRKSTVTAQKDSAIYYIVAGSILAFLDFVLLILFCCIWDKIILATEIIKATADYITDVKRIILIPPFMIFLVLMYMIYWTISGVYMFSAGETYHNPNYPWGSVKRSIVADIGIYVKFFSLFWVNAFILYTSNFILVTVVCIWYFSHNRDNLGSPIAKGFHWAFITHLGTVSFGALLLGSTWIFRIILSFIYKKIKSARESNKAVGSCLKCLGCYTVCYEKVFKYFCKLALIETALRDTNFCTSSVRGFAIASSSVLKFGILDGISELMMLFGTFAISAGCTGLGYWLLKVMTKQTDRMVAMTFAPLVVRKIKFLNYLGHLCRLLCHRLPLPARL